VVSLWIIARTTEGKVAKGRGGDAKKSGGKGEGRSGRRGERESGRGTYVASRRNGLAVALGSQIR